MECAAKSGINGIEKYILFYLGYKRQKEVEFINFSKYVCVKSKFHWCQVCG